MHWGTTYEYNKHKLKILQNKALRIIEGVDARASPEPLYSKHKLLPLDEIVKLEIMKFVYAHSNNILPKPLLETFTLNRDIHDHFTRQATAPHTVKYNYAIMGRSFLHQGPELWVKLPPKVKTSKTKNSFLRQAKKYLFAHL